ncbi:dihydroorotase family protein [Streptomyces sp. NPDC048106]|uniref:dihydroorotase n=1 Tax=Streptomyces sp. NPDC048106 TaxID=3155750 RepID=UPI0034517888
MDRLTPAPHTPPCDLVVEGGRLVTPDGVHDATIAVHAGRITALLPPTTPTPAAATRVDARGRYVLPGLIDSHVHFRTPGLTHKEDWAHAGRAAAAGGVTTVIDMPNTQPPLHSAEAAHAKADLIKGTSLVDYRFHMGVAPHTIGHLTDLDPRIATSVKVFMAGHHTAPDVIHDHATLSRIFATCADRGLRVVLHAEDTTVFHLLDDYLAAPRTYRDYETRRPRSGAIVAVARILDLVREHGTHAHILHVSSAEECDLLAAARHTGLPVTFETTPHHLSFTHTDTQRTGARTRISPSIRTQADQDRLWHALTTGELATVGSDHAPHTIEEKTRPPAEAPPGLPGVQELLPVLLTGLRRRHPHRHLDDLLPLVASLCSARPAELFGLAARKGRIAPGHDADLVVLDPDATWCPGPDTIQSKCGWSAYEGWTLTGRAETTIRRGEIIFDHAGGRFGSPTGDWLDPTAP